MRRFDDPILVTRPYLPPLEEFQKGCEEIWRNRWLTNNGPLLHRFEAELATYLGVPETNLALFNNGTLALELGYYAMGLSGGDVITTPFTFVATSHALKRIDATPIFADIDSETLCLDPKKVERLITSRTKAIAPVHVYGHVCDTEAFAALSEKYGIPIVYDAAHAFGIGSVTTCGDLSMFSFHPTKLFHSCEGGCLVFKDRTRQEKLFRLRNFAIKSETECVDVGTNAKMTELQALMGLCCLRKVPELLAKRRLIYEAYAEVLGTDAGCGCTADVRLFPYSANHAYIPVLFRDNATREKVYNELRVRCNVFSRRYFHPLLTDFAPYVYAHGTCPIAEDIASRILTLPTYHDLAPDDAKDIARNVREIIE